MAAALGASSTSVYSEDEITEILASIERIPCFEKDKVFNYKVTSLNVPANFKASSSFEAAIKFGFMLRHVGLASNTTPDCLPFEITCECRETEELLCLLLYLVWTVNHV